jgi:hypothetical protein
MQIADSDVVVGIFWKRFGTPTRDAQSGTEHELHNERLGGMAQERSAGGDGLLLGATSVTRDATQFQPTLDNVYYVVLPTKEPLFGILMAMAGARIGGR